MLLCVTYDCNSRLISLRLMLSFLNKYAPTKNKMFFPRGVWTNIHHRIFPQMWYISLEPPRHPQRISQHNAGCHENQGRVISNIGHQEVLSTDTRRYSRASTSTRNEGTVHPNTRHDTWVFTDIRHQGRVLSNNWCWEFKWFHCGNLLGCHQFAPKWGSHGHESHWDQFSSNCTEMKTTLPHILPNSLNGSSPTPGIIGKCQKDLLFETLLQSMGINDL